MAVQSPHIPTQNEDGYAALLATLVLLALLTVIAFSASRVANIEVTMARNELVHKRNFYLAEGAALEAADRLVKLENLNENSRPWMELITGNLDIDNLRLYWDNSAAAGDAVVPEPSVVDPAHTLFLVGHDGTAQGASVAMSSPTVHSISIYGRCEWDGSAVIKMGFRAAY